MDLSGLSVEELREVAGSLEGFSCDPTIKKVDLRDALNKYLEENPNALSGNTPPEGNTPPDKETGLVRIKSVHRGEIASSFGVINFGTDGIAEVSPEVAEKLTSIKGYDKC